MGEFRKYVYRFGGGVVDGDGTMRDVLGGKGAGLAEMTGLSVPIPPGFTISTEVSRWHLEHSEFPPDLYAEVREALNWLERLSDRGFGDPNNPLLVSVRSGSPVSMPGMMDTVLNVGVNDECIQGLTRKSGSKRFALDSYKRLLQMFGTVILGVPKKAFEHALQEIRLPRSVNTSEGLSEAELCQATQVFKSVILQHVGRPFPQNPWEQLAMSIEAVFRSWSSERAKYYRKLNQISNGLGTAVTVQAMVFGNRGKDSGTGVGFTRNPSTGLPGVFGEYLSNAQGEDIVSGVRTPMPIAELSTTSKTVYDELAHVASRLEKHYKDVQDLEFTVENGKLYLLQTRAAKRTAQAAVKIAVDLADEGLITNKEALMRVDPSTIMQLLAPQLDLSLGEPLKLATGLPASPGAAVGIIALSADNAVTMSGDGQPVILVTEETRADDIHGMAVSVGFLTSRGGATSHAAVVARGMGKCCITGVTGISIDHTAGTVRIGTETLCEGDWLSLEGNTGRVFEGKQPMRAATDNHPELDRLIKWALESRCFLVRANLDTPGDAVIARAAGAVGIGLCRTEHMFFATDRLAHMRTMILATNTTDRIVALDSLLPMQQSDFEELFRTMSPLPVTIRLLDPPLHEFLPSVTEIDEEIAGARRDENWESCVILESTRTRIQTLTETNPMMGHRGCRLSVTYPEILRMQVRAILQAALRVAAEGFLPAPEIMVPLIASEEEIRVLAHMIHETAEETFARQSERVSYSVGTMIELPRAAICAGPISKHVDFISFGTNDLTQMAYGFSRDDARSYLESYLNQGILKSDPFITIDREGVGCLMKMAIESARTFKPNIKVGVCGEHGGDPESIRFFQELGVDYVSCSPARLRVAQLAAAQFEGSLSDNCL